MRKFFKILTWISITGLIGSIIWTVVRAISLRSNVLNDPLNATSDLPSAMEGVFSAFPFLFGFVPLLFIGVFGQKISNPFTEKKLQESGLLALATLVSIQETGMSVNSRPQVEMTFDYTTQNNIPARGTYRIILSMTEIAQFQIGSILPIRYDINKPDAVVLDPNVDQNTLQDLVDDMRVKDGTLSQESVDIAKNGEKATGVILENTPTGKVDSKGRSELSLRVKITTKDGSTYETQTTRFIMAGAIPNLQVGCVVDIFYMPHDPHKITICTPQT